MSYYRTDCSHCLDGQHNYIFSKGKECWCCGASKEEVKEEKMENLFGKLTNESFSKEKVPFKLVAMAWKRLWDDKDVDPEEMHIYSTHGYRVDNWNDDTDGGPGLCLVVEFENRKGKPYTTQVIIPKDELIKALALLVE